MEADEFVPGQPRPAVTAIEFDDLLLLCRSLLRDNREVRQLVAQRFQVVLVDEFQDTGPVQCEIIRLVTSDPSDDGAVPQPGRLVVVGDPKQAIYSFRGADIRTYLGARGGFPGEQYRLTTNFRSVEPIITWVNDVFSRLFVASDVQPEYLPLEPHHTPSSADPPGPAIVELRDVEPPDADSEVVEKSEAQPSNSRALEPQLVGSTIRQAIDDAWLITEPTAGGTQRRYQRACRYRDVAVLMPSRTGVPDLLSAFDRLGIPYRSSDAQIVLDRPAVSGLVAALRILDDPDDQFAFSVAPTTNCSATGRPAAPGGPTIRPMRAAVAASNTPSTCWPVSATTVLDALVDDTRLFETLALVPRGVFDSDCVRMLQGHVQNWQDGGGVGRRDYLTAVEELADNTSRATLDEPDDRDDDAVRISTIHGAKGLEYPIVALAGMAIGVPNFGEAVGVRADGGIEISVAGVKTAGYANLKEAERDPHGQAERLRLLYVACTRARDHLIVSVLGDGRSRPAAIRDAVLAVNAVQVDTPNIPAADAIDVAGWEFDPLPDDRREQLGRIRATSAVSWVSSPSRAGAMLDADLHDQTVGVSGQADSGVAEVDSGPSLTRRARDGRPVGRALHAAWDQLFSAAGPPNSAEEDHATRRAVTEEGIPDAYDDVRRRVGAAMGSGLAAEAFRAQRRWTELYLAAPQDGNGVRLI